MKKVEIICYNCGQDTLLKREAIYKGFSKIGESLICTSCNYKYVNEENVPFKESVEADKVFDDSDRSKKINIFDDDENKHLCRYCSSYIVNPFTQFCFIHKKEVQATDTCEQFVLKSNNSSDIF